MLYLKHQFQLSSRVIFLQITPHSYFKLIVAAYRWPNDGPTRARCPRATTLGQARHADLLTVPSQPVSPSAHLIKST
jgi:hypothetical protein